MVRLEFVPLPCATAQPKGFIFNSDGDHVFRMRDGTWYCYDTYEILNKPIVDQLVEKYKSYAIDGYVYRRNEYTIIRQLDRCSLFPAIYDKAMEMIVEAFTDTKLSPVQLMQIIQRIRFDPIHVHGCPQTFYVRSEVLETGVFLEVMFYDKYDEDRTVFKVCQIKDD